jgi:hypothetical protein
MRAYHDILPLVIGAGLGVLLNVLAVLLTLL